MDLQEHIAALTADKAAEHLASLDGEALAALQAELESLYRAIKAGEVEGTDPDDHDARLEVLTAIKSVRAESDVRAEAQAVLDAEAAEREATLAAMEAELLETPTEPEPETPDEGGEGGEPAPEVAEEPELVMAAAKPRVSLAALAAARKPAEAIPQPAAVTKPRWQLTDGTRADFDDRVALSKRVLEAQQSFLGANNGMVDKFYVARFKVDYPDEMYLGEHADAFTNDAKLRALAAPGKDPRSYESPEGKAIVASGGWVAPPDSRYTIPSISSAVRPVRDSLVRIGASRGAVQFSRAARLSTESTSITLWENTTDTTPGESTKARLTHPVRSNTTVTLGAVVWRERFGTFEQRAFPEDVAHAIELGMTNHARRAERRLLDAIISAVNIDISQTGLLGTARDAKHHFSQAVQEIRYTERMDRYGPVRIIVSDVLPSMMVGDVAMQQASGELEALYASEAEAERMLRSITGVNYTFARDTPTGADAFITNSDNENLADWPDNFIVPIFPEGTMAFLDGGELNLGIIRDGTLNSTNDYEMFFETFEAAAWLGPYAKTLTLVTCPAGDSQIARNLTSALCSGS